MKRLIHKFVFFIGGLIIWLRMGISFKDAMESAKETEKITWEENL